MQQMAAGGCRTTPQSLQATCVEEEGGRERGRVAGRREGGREGGWQAGGREGGRGREGEREGRVRVGEGREGGGGSGSE